MAAKRRAKAAPKKERKTAKPSRAERASKTAVTDEEKPSMPLESALALATGIMLLLALILVDYEKGVHYGDGLFFKGSYGASADSGE